MKEPVELEPTKKIFHEQGADAPFSEQETEAGEQSREFSSLQLEGFHELGWTVSSLFLCLSVLIKIILFMINQKIN